MSDWEIAPKAVTEDNIKQYAGIQNGYADGVNKENPDTEVNSIDQELANPKLHPVARKALLEAKAGLSTDSGWEVAPKGSPSDARTDKSTGGDSGWSVAPPSTGEIAKGIGEAGLNFVSGMPGAMAGGVGYLTGLAASGGDLGFAKHAQDETAKAINDKIQYEPSTKMGKQVQGDIQQGMEDTINLGGESAKALVGAIPFVGKDLAKDNEIGLEAIGKAGTEMALNVIDPLAMLGGFRAGAHPKAIDAPAAKLEAIAKIEDSVPPIEPISTTAHADDFAATNPYDAGGHVTASDQGRPSTIDNPQGDLFGGEHLQEAQPVPDIGQASIRHDTIPYNKEFPFGLEDQVFTRQELEQKYNDLNEKLFNLSDEARMASPERHNEINRESKSLLEEQQKIVDQVSKGNFVSKKESVKLNFPENYSDLSLVPKEFKPDDTMPNPENGQVAEAFKKAQEEAAYKQLEETATAQKDAHYQQLEQQAIAGRHGELDYQHAKDVMGDKSLMAQDKTIEMRAYLRQGDVASVLRTIADNHPIAAYRDLAKYLSDKMDGLQIKLHSEPMLKLGERDVTGYYDPTNHTVGFSGLGATSPHTVLHELTHAVTSHFINTRPNDVRVTGLKNLFNQLNNEGKFKDFTGIVNPKEFVAEAFSNPKFQEFLKTQYMNNKTVWQRFVDGVKSIFGIRTGIETNLSNAFEHAMDLGKQIVEAQDTKAAVLDQFKKANVPNKLSDLMAQKPKDTRPEVVNNEGIKNVIGKVAGLDKIKEQFDFTPKPPEEMAALAKTAPDIPAGNLETLKANLDSGGLMASLRHNNNPIIKSTFAYVDHAIKSYEKAVRDNITNKTNGVKTMLQGLDKDDYTTIHSLMMLDEGERVRTSTELAAAGFNEKSIAAYNRIREVDTKLLAEINKVRATLNPPLPPIEPRMGHLAGRFVGDFSHMIFDEKGNAVMRVNGTTKWGAQKIADFIKQEHPEWRVDKQEYQTIKASQATDRFNGFRELMNYVGKNDPVVGKALDTLDKYNRSAATRYLDAMRHAKDKKAQAGGIIGSEGHKSWVDAQTNAEQGFRAQMAYLDNSYKWIEMQKAMENVSKVTTDPEVIKQQPNAIKWATAYTDHALHRNQGFLADFAGSLLSEVGRVTGIGHSNLTKGVNWASSAEMRNWMGIGNIPFALKHMALPFQKMPAMMAYLKTTGAEGSLVAAGARSLESYYKYLRNGTDLTSFQKEAFKFARDNNVFNVDLSDTSGKIQSSKLGRAFGKFSDVDFSAPEHTIRGTSFFFYAHLLEKSGMSTEAALSSAEHLSKFLYTNYAQHEAPRGAAKGGWIGQLALQITRYKANEIGQLGFFNRERIAMSDSEHSAMQKVMSNLPLMTHVGTLLAFTGVTGMIGYKEMDEVYSLWMKYIHGTPDNLTAVLQRSNASDLVKYGLSSRIGIDSKISEAQLLPAPFPTTAAEISQLGLAFDAARYHDEFHAKRLALSLTPSTLRGPAENVMFTQPKATTGPDAGKSLYLNPNTGQGRYARTDEEMNIRNVGFHTTAETNELQDNYSKQRIMQDNRDLATHILEKAKSLIASGIPPKEVGDRLGKQYASYQQEGQPDFAGAIASYVESQQMSQKTQMKFRAANTDRMGNSLKIMTGK